MSCVGQLFTVRQLGVKIIEKNKMHDNGLCGLIEKPYDRVNRELLWRVLESYAVNGALLRAVRSLYEDGRHV